MSAYSCLSAPAREVHSPFLLFREPGYPGSLGVCRRRRCHGARAGGVYEGESGHRSRFCDASSRNIR
ncbi:hypothetical protein NDU88_002712 [Pleurodeles waltl]|uniref:Uncharacterized protein n=1 Tax=Pleurodeles waltl TaxID=8319 RepID=A0AAV7W2X2_PLEWA|nr:hypothetical protein NDU88_002712 [Pleurodeles waltl]